MKPISSFTNLEDYFLQFRENIIGINQEFETPFGKQKIVYTDWTASGRLYAPIEEKMAHVFGPYVANTHTETSVTGTAMTKAYHEAKQIIKKHVNANSNDVLIACGTGMTGVINKFQRILGLKLAENLKDFATIPAEVKPIVFVSHMEHHSNQTSWLETIADVVVIPANENGLFSLENLEKLLFEYKDRSFKIASITSCSNVTGIKTPYHAVAKLMHQHNGVCFVDFACSAPYIEIDMHPEDSEAYLDAIFFSPHKFLGGQGTPGVLIFHKSLYHNIIPDQPGGGTVTYTNPWKYHEYITDIEHREDGGTPPFLQGIKAALAVKLKEEMGIEQMLQREEELLNIIFKRLPKVPGIELLEGQNANRLGVISFIIRGTHFNLVVKLLNDRFGIQTRGGCACAGTYGHILLHVDELHSYEILDEINSGDLSCKPGWIRMSVHPVMTNEEINFIVDAIEQVALHYHEWKTDYVYETDTNEYHHHSYTDKIGERVNDWFVKKLN
jgi:selenocysteine lyase/cysteine desulfurase